MVSTDPDVDFKETLFPLVNRDTLHEYSRWTSFVELVTKGKERLGALSDPSSFSPLYGEDLFEDVGEQWCSLVG